MTAYEYDMTPGMVGKSWLILRIINGRIHWFTNNTARKWTEEKSQAWVYRNPDECYALCRALVGFKVNYTE